MKTKLLLITALSLGNVLGFDVNAEDDVTQAAVNTSVKESRPQSSRGWFIVEKQNYWPLCYEALDRMESLRDPALSNDANLAKERLEKCSAWLGLAASASMIEEGANIYSVIQRMEEYCEELQNDDRKVDLKLLNELATMGELSMGKSHVERAANSYSEPRQAAQTSKASLKSKVLTAAEKEIRQELIATNSKQYRHDSAQAIRHLEVARKYMATAAKHGGFEASLENLSEIPELSETERTSDLSVVGSMVNLACKSMSASIAKQQAVLAKAAL